MCSNWLILTNQLTTKVLIDWHTKRQENRNYLVIFKGLVKKTLKRKWNIYFPLLNCSWYFILSSSFRTRSIKLSCLPKSNFLRSLKVQSIWSKHRLSDSVVLLKIQNTKFSCLAQIQNLVFQKSYRTALN